MCQAERVFHKSTGTALQNEWDRRNRVPDLFRPPVTCHLLRDDCRGSSVSSVVVAVSIVSKDIPLEEECWALRHCSVNSRYSVDVPNDKDFESDVVVVVNHLPRGLISRTDMNYSDKLAYHWSSARGISLSIEIQPGRIVAETRQWNDRKHAPLLVVPMSFEWRAVRIHLLCEYHRHAYDWEWNQLRWPPSPRDLYLRETINVLRWPIRWRPDPRVSRREEDDQRLQNKLDRYLERILPLLRTQKHHEFHNWCVLLQGMETVGQEFLSVRTN